MVSSFICTQLNGFKYCYLTQVILFDIILSFLTIKLFQGCPRGVMVKAMDYGIAVSEFELQSRYYVHFRTPLSSQLWGK